MTSDGRAVSVRFGGDLLAEIDKAAANRGVSRSAVIVSACEHEVGMRKSPALGGGKPVRSKPSSAALERQAKLNASRGKGK